MPKHRLLILFWLILLSNPSFGFQHEITVDKGKLGLRDTVEQKQLISNEYDAIGWGNNVILFEGLIKAKQNERWALFNIKGDRITPHEFIFLEPFKKGQLIASKRSSTSILQVFGTINQKGKTLIPFNYVRIDLDGNRLITTQKDDQAYLKGMFDHRGQEIIPPQYLDISPLSNGYYAVENRENQLALFDSLGTKITEFQFQEILRIGTNAFEVSYYNRRGAIDQKGQVIIPAIYEKLVVNEKKIVAEAYKQWTYFDGNQSVELFFEDIHGLGDSLYLVATNNDIGIINKLEQHKLYLRQHAIAGTKADLAQIKNLANGFYGVVNQSGVLMLPTIYDSIIISEKYALAKIERSNQENWFAFDQFGQRLNMIGYEKVKGKIGGYTIVERNGKEALLAKDGKELTPFQYDFLATNDKDQFIVKSSNGYGVLGKRGSWVITPYKDSIAFKGDHYYYQQGSAQGFINLEGKTLARSYDPIELLPQGYTKRKEKGFELYNSVDSLLFDYQYDTVYTLNSKHWFLQRDDLKFFYRPEDRRVFELPAHIDSLKPYQEGYIAFLKDKQWGFLDEMGQLRISNRYEAVGHFSEALCPVKLIGKWGVIDRGENLVVQPKYDSISPFYNALAIVLSNNQLGLMDRTGQLVLDLQYDAIKRHSHWIALNKGGKIGISDIRGRLIRSPQFDEVRSLNDDHFLVRKGNRYGVIDINGKDLVPLSFESIKKVKNGFLAVKPAATDTYDVK